MPLRDSKIVSGLLRSMQVNKSESVFGSSLARPLLVLAWSLFVLATGLFSGVLVVGTWYPRIICSVGIIPCAWSLFQRITKLQRAFGQELIVSASDDSSVRAAVQFLMDREELTTGLPKNRIMSGRVWITQDGIYALNGSLFRWRFFSGFWPVSPHDIVVKFRPGYYSPAAAICIYFVPVIIGISLECAGLLYWLKSTIDQSGVALALGQFLLTVVAMAIYLSCAWYLIQLMERDMRTAIIEIPNGTPEYENALELMARHLPQVSPGDAV